MDQAKKIAPFSACLKQPCLNANDSSLPAVRHSGMFNLVRFWDARDGPWRYLWARHLEEKWLLETLTQRCAHIDLNQPQALNKKRLPNKLENLDFNSL